MEPDNYFNKIENGTTFTLRDLLSITAALELEDTRQFDNYLDCDLNIGHNSKYPDKLILYVEGKSEEPICLGFCNKL